MKDLLQRRVVVVLIAELDDVLVDLNVEHMSVDETLYAFAASRRITSKFKNECVQLAKDKHVRKMMRNQEGLGSNASTTAEVRDECVDVLNDEERYSISVHVLTVERLFLSA